MRVLILCLALLLAAARPAAAELAEIDGTLVWEQGVPLPDQALVEVKLIDLERVEGRSIPLASIWVRPVEIPLEWRLVYDASLMRASGTYGLVAEMTSFGNLVMGTRRPVVVEPGSAGPGTPLELARAPSDMGETPLNKKWLVTSVRDEPVPNYTRAWLRFDPNGKLAGSMGCNALSAKAVIADRTLDLDGIAFTKRACATGLLSLERRMSRALERVAAWRIDGTRLTLSDRAGLVMLELERTY